ncbi:Ankyrin repeat domain-containing protein [Paramyrothecium foliicola]|nr:Ankyrin repeat domain-containing protein [Paramyrothecium foliicola]
MSLQRSATRRVAGGPAPIRPKKGYEVVQQGIKQLYPKPESTKATDIDIVFVPGLGANPEESWKSAKSGFNWASDEDGVARDFPTARVLLYMYESAWTGPLKVKQFIGNLALTLLHGLHEKRAVCLAESRQDLFPHMFEDISGCAVFGTPFHGAEAASVAAMLSHVGQMFDQTVPSKLLDLMKPDDEGLNELRDEFIRMVTKISPNIGLCGFYEEQPTNISDLSGVPSFIKALQIPLPKKIAEFVTKESAILGGLMVPMGLACNHRDLVKFESSKDERYSLVRNPLKKIIHGAHLVAKCRRQSTRKIDRTMVTKVIEALDGAQVSRKRRMIAQATAPSSWVIEELDSLGWLSKHASEQLSSPAKKGDCVWIRGPDGRGKTSATLAALETIDKLVETNPDYGTAEELLKSLVQQLIAKHEALAIHAKFLLRKRGKEDIKGQPQLTVENLWQVLQDMLADDYLFGSTVYFVINNFQILPPDSDSTSTLLDLMKIEIDTMNESGRHGLVRWLITSGESYSIGQALGGESVRLIDLEHEKYGNQVQLDLRRHAQKKVTELVAQKNYSKALAYFASSILGRRAQNTQWIDITCVQLEELPQNDNDLQVRRLLEAVPQELDALLNHAWRQVFDLNRDKVDGIKELLRVLVLTYEDPTEEELALLVGLYSSDKQRAELRDLLEHCRPLIVLKSSRSKTRVSFIENVVRVHLLDNAHQLLGLSEEDTKLQHGMLALRSFTHIMESLSFPTTEMVEDAGEAGDLSDAETHNDGYEGEVTADGEEHHDTQDSAISATNYEAETEGNNTVDAAENNRGEESDDDSNLSDDDDDDDDDYEDDDPEANVLKDKVLPYPVKHWLHHASKATNDIAEALSLEAEFWARDSIIRRRWLTEYVRLTGSFRYWNRSEFSALHVASSLGFKQLVASLLKNGYEEEKSLHTSELYTPLHLAAWFGRFNIAEELLNNDAPIDDGIEGGYITPLHMAAAEGKLKVMNKLLERGANPNANCGAYGGVINAAIESGNCEAVKILVEKNVSLATIEDEPEADDSAAEAENDNGPQQDSDHLNDGSGGDQEDQDDGDDGDEDGDEEDEEEEEVIRSPLALAALRSDLTMFEFLVKNYSDRLPPKEFNTALIKAAERGRIEVFKELLSSYSHSQETLQEALDGAAYGDNFEIVALLLEKCSGLNCDDAFLSMAMGDDDEQWIQTMEALWEYSQGGISQAKLDESLYEATDVENLETVQLLIRFGANVDATGEEYGNALTAAAYDGTIEIVKILLDAGASVNGPEGWALQAASSEGHMEIVELLLSKGADVNACTTHKGMPQGTALQAAVEAGNFDIVELLLQHNANPNLGAGELSCPIIAATRKGEEAILDALIAAKANVDVFGGPDMSTPLINAATYLPQSAIRSILNAGADINLADSDGDTALMMAAAVGDFESIQTLLDYGADVLHKNRWEQNALQKGLDNGNSEAIRILVSHVSTILDLLRASRENGDPSVTAIMRSVEARKQELDYDDVGVPLNSVSSEDPPMEENQPLVAEPAEEKIVVESAPVSGFAEEWPKSNIQETTVVTNDRSSYSGHPDNLEASIRRIMHVNTWDSEVTTPSSQYGHGSEQTNPTLSDYSSQEPSRFSGPATPSPTPDAYAFQRNEYRSSTPASGQIRRKPAPAPPQVFASNTTPSSTTTGSESKIGQHTGNMPLPLQPRLQQQQSMPQIQSLPPHQADDSYGIQQRIVSNGHSAHYREPSSGSSRNYQAYQPIEQGLSDGSRPSQQQHYPPPPQHHHQQQQQYYQQPLHQHQRVVSGRDSLPSSSYRQPNQPPPHHVPYAQPLEESYRRSSNPNEQPLQRPLMRPQQGSHSFGGTPQIPNGVNYGHDINKRPANEGNSIFASYYVERQLRDPACSGFWVQGDCLRNFRRDYERIAEELDLTDNLQDRLVAIRDAIQNEPKWLLVIDQVVDLSLFAAKDGPSLLPFIPKKGVGTVLWVISDQVVSDPAICRLLNAQAAFSICPTSRHDTAASRNNAVFNTSAHLQTDSLWASKDPSPRHFVMRLSLSEDFEGFSYKGKSWFEQRDDIEYTRLANVSQGRIRQKLRQLQRFSIPVSDKIAGLPPAAR